MKALFYTKYGTPDVLHVVDVEKPVPGDDEVLIKVHAASINSWDWDLVKGKPYLYRLLFGIFKPRHKTIGADVAGSIEAVGKDIKDFKIGDEVFGDLCQRWGGFAEYVCASEEELAQKPAAMSFEQAAAIPQAGVLAFQSLCDIRPIANGDKVLINGGGGGVGTFAIQIAKSYGAEVTAVDSTEKIDLMRLLGADRVVDYRKEDFTKNGKQYDIIVDVVSNRSVFAYKPLLTPRGILSIVGGKIWSLLQTAIIGGLLSRGNQNLGLVMHKPNKDLETIKGLFESGYVTPIIDRTFPLSDAVAAFHYFGTGTFKGKIVITIHSNSGH